MYIHSNKTYHHHIIMAAHIFIKAAGVGPRASRRVASRRACACYIDIIYIHIHTYMHTYTDTYIYIYIHTYIHIALALALALLRPLSRPLPLRSSCRVLTVDNKYYYYYYYYCYCCYYYYY